jgi:hypothetical protein
LGSSYEIVARLLDTKTLIEDAKQILSTTDNGLRNEKGYLMSFPSDPQNKGYAYNADGICNRDMCKMLMESVTKDIRIMLMESVKKKKKDVYNVDGIWKRMCA